MLISIINICLYVRPWLATWSLTLRTTFLWLTRHNLPFSTFWFRVPCLRRTYSFLQVNPSLFYSSLSISSSVNLGLYLTLVTIRSACVAPKVINQAFCGNNFLTCHLWEYSWTFGHPLTPLLSFSILSHCSPQHGNAVLTLDSGPDAPHCFHRDLFHEFKSQTHVDGTQTDIFNRDIFC